MTKTPIPYMVGFLLGMSVMALWDQSPPLFTAQPPYVVYPKSEMDEKNMLYLKTHPECKRYHETSEFSRDAVISGGEVYPSERTDDYTCGNASMSITGYSTPPPEGWTEWSGPGL